MTHFLDIAACDPMDIRTILDRSRQIRESGSHCLTGKSVGMIFEKPSNRTRVSFEVGIQQLGGHAVYMQGDDIQIGDREPVSHVARVLSRYVDMLVYRTNCHQRLMALATHATIPVVNGLSDYCHPCQAIADVLTISDHVGALEDVVLTYVGDGNNVCQSLMHVAQACGMRMHVICPKAYAPTDCPSVVSLWHDMDPNVLAGTHALYTDVWVSMGQESESDARKQAFQPYQINDQCMQHVPDNAIFLHCLPAIIGEEVTDTVLESSASKVFDQAENRLHAQKGIMAWLMERSAT